MGTAGDTATGRTLLEKLLKSDFPDKSTVHFFLGQLDEEQKKPEAALAHFRQVTTGDHITPTATVTLTGPDGERTEVAMGTGPVNAIYKAINAIAGVNVRVARTSCGAGNAARQT